MESENISSNPNGGTSETETYILGTLTLEEAAQHATIWALGVGLASLVVAAVAFLYSQSSLSARVKRLHDLEEFARRYHARNPKDLDADQGERHVSPVKDALVEYRRTLKGIHGLTTLGLGRIVGTIILGFVSFLLTAFLLELFLVYGLGISFNIWWALLCAFIGAIPFLLIVFLVPWNYRRRLDKELNEIRDVHADLRKIFGINAPQKEKNVGKLTESPACKCQEVSASNNLVILISSIVCLIMSFFSRQKGRKFF